jgi:hypothetical protein
MALTYDGEIHLVIPCTDYSPDFAASKIDLLEKSHKGITSTTSTRRYPKEATSGLFTLFESAFTGLKNGKNLKLSTVRLLSSFLVLSLLSFMLSDAKYALLL